ncbi:XRE family transcriptional regulator (fragment) [Beijerinckiaceae bacterium RH AL1]
MSGTQTFANVWDALEDSPEAAAHMRLRSELMIVLQDAIERWQMPPADAAARLAINALRSTI